MQGVLNHGANEYQTTPTAYSPTARPRLKLRHLFAAARGARQLETLKRENALAMERVRFITEVGSYAMSGHTWLSARQQALVEANAHAIDGVARLNERVTDALENIVDDAAHGMLR